MERTLRVKRIFSLGQYQNIEISDEVVGIPNELATDEVAIKLLSYLQLLNLERRANKYYQLREKYRDKTPEEAVQLIENEIAETQQAFYGYIKSKE